MSFSVLSGPASIAGSTITLDGVAGTVIIQAKQGGDDTFNAAPRVTRSFEVIKVDQTIEFPILADKITTDVPFEISATASSDLLINFSIVSGPASISGNTITLDGIAGTVIVHADQEGNDTYAAAATVVQSFEVNQTGQTITFSSIADKLTTDAPFDINAIASSGLTVSFSIESGPASISGNTITLDGIGGTVVVHADQAGNATYAAAPTIVQSFEVNQAGQTITFPSIANRLTTDDPFDISASASSGLPINFSIVSGPAVIFGNTITLDGVPGTVIVQAAQFGNTTYEPAPVITQSFEIVEPALSDQIISFPAISNRLTTDAPFAINASASSGLPVNFSIVSGPATITGNTITLNGVVGTVVVQADQSGNDQFNPAASVQQSFQVVAPDLQEQTISFPSLPNRLNTDAPFQINATANSGLPVSFSIISGPATVSGNTITLNGVVGTVLVQADQPGNNQFNPAASVQQTFHVLLNTYEESIDLELSIVPYTNELLIWNSNNITFSLTNTGGIAATNIIVDLPIPPSFAYIGSSAELGSHNAWLEQWELDSLDGGETAAMTLDLFVLQDEEIATIYSEVSEVDQNDIDSAANNNPGPTPTEDDEAIAILYPPGFQADQTITFPAIGDRLTTDASFDISATASSGLAVSFSIISGPASISGNTITLDGVTGMVVVQADQGGNGTYNAALSVQQSFEVGTPALQDQTITFLAIGDRLTTDAPFDISATASSGLAVSFTIISGPASISGNTISLDGVTGNGSSTS